MATEQHRLILNTKSVATRFSKETRSPQWNFYTAFEVIFEGLTRIAVTTFHPIPTGISSNLIARMNLGVAQGQRTRLSEIIDELDALKRRADNLPDYAFRPTKHAFRSARYYIFETYLQMGEAFPRPSFVLDGESGIILKWTRNGHSVRLNCMAELGEQDYIYFENGEYDIEDNVTPAKLHGRLNWLLNQHAG